MKKNIAIALTFLLLQMSAIIASAAERGWNPADDIARLSREVPSIQAFNTDGVVWMNSYNYSLLADGTMRKEHRYLLLLDDAKGEHGINSHAIQHPREEGASVEITEASWFTPSGTARGGSLPVETFDENGIGYTLIRFPAETGGNVAAVSVVFTFPMRYYMDDLLPMAYSLPIWEQNVNVQLPEGMDVYWEGVGVRAPQRSRENGVELITWSVLNQPGWKERGLINETRPMLLFSLQRGLISHLKNLGNMEYSFRAPAIPQSFSSLKGNLGKAGDAIHKYMAERALVIGDFSPEGVRPREFIAQAEKWTDWERTLIAGKWLRELGYNVKVFWCQKLPVSQLGPTSGALWKEPVLQITQSGAKDVFYKADQITDFGKLAPSLYGASAYRFEETDIERLVLPKGSAAEHTFLQTWKMSMGESGIAEGTLGLTVAGGWVDVLGLGRTPEIEGLGEKVLEKIHFLIPGFQMEPKSVKPAGSGYRIVFDVKATLGIASGGEILMHLPNAIPACFDEIPPGEAKYAFKFPFVMDRNVIISTPPKYKPVMLPAKTEIGDSKAQLEESVAHWPKKSRIEASSKWAVRTSAIDEFFSRRIAEQLMTVLRWSQTGVPFRK